MRLLEYFRDFHTQIDHNPFHIKGTWIPPQHRDTALDAFICAVERDILNLAHKPVRDNLTTPERDAVKQLRRRTDSFEFNNTLYIQSGTAMGTTDALSHAPHHPHTWWRFIDDIFMI